MDINKLHAKVYAARHPGSIVGGGSRLAVNQEDTVGDCSYYI